MQNAKAKIPVMFVFLSVISACIMRLFQLIDHSDALSIPLYAVLAFGTVMSGLYAFFTRDRQRILDFETKSKSLCLITIMLSLALFFDFLHQCYNCFDYIQSVAYVEYTYVIPIGVSGMLALVSSFYFAAFAMTFRNINYDVRNFTWLHFAPVLWVFCRLLMIMSRLVDIKKNYEICCEFLLLSSLIGFLFCILYAVERRGERISCVFGFFAPATFMFSLSLGIPHIIGAVSSGIEVTDNTTFSGVTYIMLGIFALALLKKTKTESNKN